MLPFEQGSLDSLCGIYSVVNAERIINSTTHEGSQALFVKIIHYLDTKGLLASILTEGMLLKHIKLILTEVVQERILYKKIPFAGVSNPDLNTFWNEMTEFVNEPHRAVLLGLAGVHDHWTVVKSITEKQIQLFDSDSIRFLRRANCTTADFTVTRRHVLFPAQTFFLGRS
jgi:hypothetical protein